MSANISPPTSIDTRRYDLDWIRVLAILAVFCYHSLRFFTLEDWHVKNPTTYPLLEDLANYGELWMMPLIFVISGASIFFASLKNKPAGKFIQDKTLRLFIPLGVGIFTHSIVQVYLERLSHGDFTGSFWQFLPHYFEGFYRLGGNFAWMGLHLWYLEVLFVFSLIILPGILLLRSRMGKRMIHKLTDLLALPCAVYILPFIAVLSWKLLDPDSVLGKDIFGWSLGAYFTFFLAGYLLVANKRLGHSIERQRWISLVGVLASTLLYFVTKDHEEFLVWFAILACLGFARRHLNAPVPLLGYANQAVLPFYILHQPILVVIGFFVVQWQVPDLLKYVVIAVPSFLLTLGLYELLVSRSNLMRFLFGMKSLPSESRSYRTDPLGRFNGFFFSLMQKISPKGISK